MCEIYFLSIFVAVLFLIGGASLYSKVVHKHIESTKYHWAFDNTISVCEMRKLLQRHKPRKWMTTYQEQEFYKHLPDYVTLYRGGHINEASTKYGISWTTSRPVAEFFAFRHTTESRAVFGTIVPKTSIRAVFTDREEKECLLIDPISVEVVTTYPTEFYAEYQRFRADYDRKEKALYNEVCKMLKMW